MSADEKDVKPLAERVVKEAVTLGLDTPMREPILEAIDEAGEGKKDPSRTVPMAGVLLGLGAAAGYVLGTRDTDFDVEDVAVDDLEEPDVINDVVGEEFGADEDSEESETDEETEGGSGSRLRPLLLGLSLVAAVALIRRKLQSSGDEWEPIEEFESDDEDEDGFGGDFGVGDDEEGGEDEDDEDEFGADDEEGSEDEDDQEEDEAVEVEEEEAE